ncbi:hypothetical protein C5167_050805 [Papaver somniferum]|uniref:Inhibitor I9 domain-containing protein n=1 Tax=Papaver somniferum TaxID=3469 RepID=A0A4Y7KT84_PAPSO|nr:hypothetical protein C5167_050805 [Papaver somniferum]
MNKLIGTVLTLLLLRYGAINEAAASTTKHYIVYMGDHSYPDLSSVVTSNDVFVKLRKQQFTIIARVFEGSRRFSHQNKHNSFAVSSIRTPYYVPKTQSVFESRISKLHTTHSWEFLGVDAIPQYNQFPEIESKSDVIVGVLDSGIWPESESFNDKGLGPVPKRFKG